MARITVEDCGVENRFDLVLWAMQRTRQIISGEKITIADTKEEKKPVIALREIAAGTVSIADLKEDAIKSFRTFSEKEEIEEDIDDLAGEDTYNPHLEIEIKSVEGETGLTVSDIETLSSEEAEDIETFSTEKIED